MDVKVTLSIGEEQVKEETLHIDDRKLQDMSEDDIEAIIEIRIKDWANNLIGIAWETVES